MNTFRTFLSWVCIEVVFNCDFGTLLHCVVCYVFSRKMGMTFFSQKTIACWEINRNESRTEAEIAWLANWITYFKRLCYYHQECIQSLNARCQLDCIASWVQWKSYRLQSPASPKFKYYHLRLHYSLQRQHDQGLKSEGARGTCSPLECSLTDTLQAYFCEYDLMWHWTLHILNED